MMKTIKLTKTHLKKAQKFAEERMGSAALYKKRGGFKQEDIIVGALAEMGAYKFLKEHGIKTPKPDFTIHDKKSKSYDADLPGEEYKFHVKGQSESSRAKYGSSWLLGRSDPLVKSPIPNNFLVLCNVNIEELTVDIKAIIPSSVIHAYHAWGECSIEWLRRNKVALYMSTLEHLPEYALWGILDE